MNYATNVLTGFICINKPVGRTSFSVINTLKRLLPKKSRIGHCGTLDPFASGLLIVGIGRPATRLMQQLQQLDKKYRVTAQLGVLTDTLDNTGVVLQTIECKHVTIDDLYKSITLLRPGYMQIPPVYSACKHNGTRLYDLARNSAMDLDVLHSIVQQKQRLVSIYACDVIAYELPYFTLNVHVSHGTYIRTLVNDIARGVHSCATACMLERTHIGPWNIEHAISIDAITTIDDIASNLVSVEMVQQILQSVTSR